MGLVVEVGILADLKSHDAEGYSHHKRQLAQINECLRRSILPPYAEPEDIAVSAWDLGNHWALHCLRRLGAWLNLEGRLPPPGEEDSSEDPIVERYYNFERGRRAGQAQPTFDHLIFHSDVEGYYVPVDFPEVLFPDEDLEIDGGMLGSVHRLLSECQLLARLLELPEDLDPGYVMSAVSRGQGDQPWIRYGVEAHTCSTLLHTSRVALSQSAAIVLC